MTEPNSGNNYFASNANNVGIKSNGTGNSNYSETARRTAAERGAPENAFENTEVNLYNHIPNIVPPYVLDTLSRAHYKDQLNNTNVNSTEQSETNPSSVKSVHSKQNDEDQYLSFANDPYVKSMNQDWNKFLNSVEQPNAYTRDKLYLDKDYSKEWNLDGSWDGDKRLREALVGTLFGDDKTIVQERAGFFSRLIGRGIRDDKDNPRVRSKAGYWMSDVKKQDMISSIKRTLVRNPLIPLFLRILIIIFSTCALALSCNIFVLSHHKYEGNSLQEQPSTIMAIVVQCCAVVYVIYIAYDEYHGEPLGLRDPLGKMKLIMLDLLFIIY
ncbi:uncharacterized protein RJT20DRAFT_50799 [Scheffersomyces xylosifermentans]|uniref:uncharacterized protein n=1 Tax=Scheffersomyces xylosifermentans TaxID=1304137 RepID=UPI00315CA625